MAKPKPLDLTFYKSDLEGTNQTLFQAEIAGVHERHLSVDVESGFAEAQRTATCVYDLTIDTLGVTLKDVQFGGFSVGGWTFAPVLPGGTKVMVAVSRDKTGSVVEASIVSILSAPPVRTIREEGLPTLQSGDIMLSSSGGAMVHLKANGNVTLQSSEITQSGRKALASIKLGLDTKSGNPSTGNPNVLSVELADRGTVFGVDSRGNMTFNAPEVTEAFMRLIENVDYEKNEKIGFFITKDDKRDQEGDHGTKRTSIGRANYKQVGHLELHKTGFHSQKMPFAETELGIKEGYEHNIKGDFGLWVGEHYDEWNQASGGNGHIHIAKELGIDVIEGTKWQAGDWVEIEKHMAIPFMSNDVDGSMQSMLSILLSGLSLAKEPAAKADVLVSILKWMAMMFDQHRHATSKETVWSSPPPYTIFKYMPHPMIGLRLNMIPSNILKIT